MIKAVESVLTEPHNQRAFSFTKASMCNAASLASELITGSTKSAKRDREGVRRVLLKQEWGGPVVALPTCRSFGSRLIERALAQKVHGKMRPLFGSEGVMCTIKAPESLESAELQESAT